ncbi:MAG: hypothetical protein EBY09_18795, partial [Verrucomicrobia bacterium]|nr:hypothetical protein [Verrucomicrobiota bacterium]NDF00984.1 hypothetical protein [Verrucomicrobiota bacterium]
MNLRAPLGQAIPRRARWIAGIELLATVPRQLRLVSLVALALLALMSGDAFGAPTVILRRATTATRPSAQAQVVQEGNSTIYFEMTVSGLGLGDTLTATWRTPDGGVFPNNTPGLTELAFGMQPSFSTFFGGTSLLIMVGVI